MASGLGNVFERYAHIQPEQPAVLDPVEGIWSYQEQKAQRRLKLDLWVKSCQIYLSLFEISQ